MLLLACFLLTQQARAAALTAVSDIMTRQQVAVGSNHEIHFDTPTGVDAPADTITLTFANGFDLSLISGADIDLFHGPVTGFEVNESVAAGAGNGVWGASIVGQVVTLTAPTDAVPGEIPAGDTVVIRIGTHVVGGTKQILNPVSAGRHLLNIAGTFGDSDSFFVPIVSNDGLEVSVTIPATTPPPGGGGSGGPPPGPTTPSATSTPPTIVISNARALFVTTSSASILWSTNTSTDSRVDYGFTTAYASGTRQSGDSITSHQLNLNGLTPGTIYRVLITSRHLASNTAVSQELVFTTQSEPRTLTIINPRITLITDSSMTVLWETSEDASRIVEYGTSTAYGASQSSAALGRSHSLTLNGLLAGTVYHVRILALTPDGVSAVSGDLVAQTAPDRTPPTNALFFKAVGEPLRIGLSWVNPPEADFRFVEIRARTDRSPISRADGRFVYLGPAMSFVDAPLSPALRYYYTLFAVDASNNASSGALADAMPLPSSSTSTATSTPPIRPPTTEPSPEAPSSTRPPGPPTDPGETSTTTASSTVPFPTTRPTSTEPLAPDAGAPTGTIITLPVTGATSTSSTDPLPGVSATITSSTVSVPASLPIFPTYFALSGSLELRPAADGLIGALVGQPLLVRLPIQGLPSIRTAELRVEGGSAYRLTLSPQGDAWIASFLPRADVGRAVMTVQVSFDDGRVARASSTVLVKAAGQVREGRLVERQSQPVSDAIVTVLVKQGRDYVVWRPLAGQANPLKTDLQGRYAFFVPAGDYRLVIRKEGYKEKIIDVRSDHQLLVSSVELYRLPRNLAEVIRDAGSFQEQVSAVGQEIETALGVALETVQTPDNQAVAEQVVTPVVVTIAVANTATAVSAFSLLNYLQFLFTQPLLLLKRRKRMKWGIVYNALTKQPIDLAIIRLLRAGTRLVVQTRITDAQGRYSFMAQPGEYVVEVIKPNVIYPSKLMRNERVDTDFVDLYHGESIQVKSASVLTMNIPVDPVERVETPHLVLRKKWLRRIQNAAGLVGIGASVFAWIVSPTWLMAAFILVQILFYAVFRRLALPPKPKDWGIIYEDSTRKALEHVVVRIFDKKYNKLLETQVTDSHGRYGFVVGKNIYYVIADKTGYERYRSADLDLTKASYGTIDQKIQLKKAK